MESLCSLSEHARGAQKRWSGCDLWKSESPSHAAFQEKVSKRLRCSIVSGSCGSCQGKGGVAATEGGKSPLQSSPQPIKCRSCLATTKTADISDWSAKRATASGRTQVRVRSWRTLSTTSDSLQHRQTPKRGSGSNDAWSTFLRGARQLETTQPLSPFFGQNFYTTTTHA